MRDHQQTFHININDYVEAVGVQAFADAFIPAMQNIIESGKEVTVDELLYAFIGNLQDDAVDYWMSESNTGQSIKSEFRGEMLTHDEYNIKYGDQYPIHVEFYDWDEKKLMEPDLLYYVKLTIENSDYIHKEKLLAKINLRG
jgi:hypothetical protein